jgi:hypothetical protein
MHPMTGPGTINAGSISGTGIAIGHEAQSHVHTYQKR